MAYKILHVSHTDIRSDSRILKELRSLEQLSDSDIYAIGVSMPEEGVVSKVNLLAKVFSLRLVTKALFFLPRPIRYLFNMAELTARLVYCGIRIYPHVVHCHDTLVLPAGLLLKIFTRCRLVYDAHELESNKNGQTRALSFGTLFIERVCWNSIDLLISVSDSIIDWYKCKFGKKNSVLVLNSPEIDDNFSLSNFSDRNYFRKLYNIPQGRLVFVYLGILTVGRGIDILLEAFSAECDSHLVFVGYGDYEPVIKKYSENHGNIHLHPPVEHSQVVPLVKNADVGLCLIENVSLSDYYCLPNKLFEYCFAGLKVLACDFPEIAKVVKCYSLGITCSLNVDSVRKAVSSFERERENSSTVDLRDLSWGAQADRLLESYRNLLLKY